ncbi:MAG: UDP-N-acetylmuramoyl-L-alanyl-D-glutamate--2,6-diaminopimelate ligase, partial [Candidatus Neomarinimicrobiota bacterium]
MKQSLVTLLNGLDSALPPGVDVEVSGLQSDSRLVRPGDLFVAVKGYQADGNAYVQDAIDRGAVAVITSDPGVYSEQVPVIRVANDRRAASYLADRFFHSPSTQLSVIGITGTNGKTTTATLLTSILSEQGFRVAQMGTLGLIAPGYERNKSLTTPDAIALQRTFSRLLEDR